jgi:hypothetical protein
MPIQINIHLGVLDGLLRLGPDGVYRGLHPSLAGIYDDVQIGFLPFLISLQPFLIGPLLGLQPFLIGLYLGLQTFLIRPYLGLQLFYDGNQDFPSPP